MSSDTYGDKLRETFRAFVEAERLGNVGLAGHLAFQVGIFTHLRTMTEHPVDVVLCQQTPPAKESA